MADAVNREHTGLFDTQHIIIHIPELKATFPVEEIASSACRVVSPASVNIKAYIGVIAQRSMS